MDFTTGFISVTFADDSDKTWVKFGEFASVDIKTHTNDHSKLENLNAPNQHPIKAIVGLSDELAQKVEKEDGKQLSTNDYTNEDKLLVQNAAQLIDLATVATTGSYSDLSNQPIHYHSTEWWNEHREFIPNQGDICIYSDYKIVTDTEGNEKYIPGIKVADGLAYIVDQPFVNEGVNDIIEGHINDYIIHITAAEREKWNNKVTTIDTVSEENLILTRD